jgi:hypothetical protein
MIEIKGEEQVEKRVFGLVEERGIISLIFDQPEFITAIFTYLNESYFENFETKYVFSLVKHEFDKHGIIMSRQMCVDIAKDTLTAADPHREIIDLINHETDPREAPIIIEKLVGWARQKAYSKIYTEEAMQAHSRGDYNELEKIIEEARRISEFQTSFYFFFDQIESLFVKENEIKLTTGFSRLDHVINMGGPTRGDVFCWLAPTGVGKCHTLESKIILERLSEIFELELENGEIIKLAGFREIQTKRGTVKVCDLTEEDDIIKIPDKNDTPDVALSDL